MNYLVEDWGGKYQSQEISAKNGVNIDLLLEKVLLEAEILELKANPDKPAVGTVIESSLDKGRGFTATFTCQIRHPESGRYAARWKLFWPYKGYVQRKRKQNKKARPIHAGSHSRT